MQTEQRTPQEALDQSIQTAQRHEGTPSNDGGNLGFDIGEIARQKKIASALADATAATEPNQPTVEMVEKHLEYVPSGQQAVHMNGLRVLAMRKPDSEINKDRINIFDDRISAAPYLKEASWKGFNEQSF